MLLTPANQEAATYSLENLELEYETITNPELPQEIKYVFIGCIYSIQAYRYVLKNYMFEKFHCTEHDC